MSDQDRDVRTDRHNPGVPLGQKDAEQKNPEQGSSGQHGQHGQQGQQQPPKKDAQNEEQEEHQKTGTDKY